MKVRKIPVVVDAWRVDDLRVGSWSGAPEWIREALRVPRYAPGAIFATRPEFTAEPLVYIATLEGPMRVAIGDWIIRGVAGELYPCKPEIFAATYEVVE